MVDAPSVVAQDLWGRVTPVAEGGVVTTMMNTGNPRWVRNVRSREWLIGHSEDYIGESASGK
jgi:hypothetical protein